MTVAPMPGRQAAAHFRSAYVRRAKYFSPTTVDRPAPAATADHRQADYFLRLLTDHYRLVEQRIDEYQREIAIVEAAGDGDRARSCRRKMRTDERERRAVRRLIDNLRRRFFADEKIPAISRGTRLSVR
jgi:hypothetical protein